MANSNSRYKEKSNPILSVLYVIVVLVLVAALIFMYKIYRDKRNAYKLLVQSASETDAGYDIAARKADLDASGELEDEPYVDLKRCGTCMPVLRMAEIDDINWANLE